MVNRSECEFKLPFTYFLVVASEFHTEHEYLFHACCWDINEEFAIDPLLNPSLIIHSSATVTGTRKKLQSFVPKDV